MKLEGIYKRSPVLLQTAMLNLKAIDLHRERYGSKYERIRLAWEPNEFRSTDELRAMQDLAVSALVDHAINTVPFYRERYGKLGVAPGDIRSVEDLQLLPMLTKDDIRSNLEGLTSETTNRRQLREGNTSGTTGSPLTVRYDVPVCVAHHVVDWRQKAWGGVLRGQPYASLQGRMIVPAEHDRPPFWRMNYLHHQLFLSAFHLTDRHLPHYVKQLRERRIQFLEGYPSTVGILAAWMLGNGEKLPLRAVFTSSETLHDWQRDDIEKAFECQVFDSLGMAERVLFASECEAHEGRHLSEDYGVTELLDDSGHDVRPGEPGRIVATGLVNRAFPLIRYITNDVSSRIVSPCACGRTFPRLASVTTKQEAIITLPDGRLVSPSVLTHPFKPMHRVAASQILQDSLTNIRVRIVRREGYGAEDERVLLAGLRERLGTDVEVSIEYVESVAAEPGTKFRWVVTKVHPSFGGSADRDITERR